MNEIYEELKKISDIHEIEPYTLVNNYGCTFKINNIKYDVRRWVNMYGVDLQYGIMREHCANITDLTLEQIIKIVKIIAK